MFFNKGIFYDAIDELKELIEEDNLNKNDSNNYTSYDDFEDKSSHN